MEQKLIVSEYCLKKQIALPGGDIKVVTFKTVEACKEECVATAGCHAFEARRYVFFAFLTVHRISHFKPFFKSFSEKHIYKAVKL